MDGLINKEEESEIRDVDQPAKRPSAGYQQISEATDGTEKSHVDKQEGNKESKENAVISMAMAKNGSHESAINSVESSEGGQMTRPPLEAPKLDIPLELGEPDSVVGPAVENGSNDKTLALENGQGLQNTSRREVVSKGIVNPPQASETLSSMVFVISSIEHIAASKEARKRKQLGDAAQKVLTAIKKKDQSIDPELIFEPLHLATETGNTALITVALDCIGKLISYSYFSIPTSGHEVSASASQDQQPPLIDRAIETICDCFQDEATPAEIQLQIVKSLLAAVLNDKFIVHGSGLLKAIRQVYNIFLLSKSSANQQVAQGTLSQMVGTVFERVTARLAMKEARISISRLASERGTANGSQVEINGSISATGSNEVDHSTDADALSESNSIVNLDRPAHKDPGEKMTLQSFENVKSFDDAKIGDNAPTMVTRAKPIALTSQPSPELPNTIQNGYEEDNSRNTSDEEEEEDEIFIKDAYLVFRSMCRLSIKQLDIVQQQDVKSSSMRSKLVSLSIIRTLLNNNMVVFTSPLITIRSSTNNEPTIFGQAINQYLRLSLSKNGASSVKQVFDCCCEIFWLMMKSMRVMLKVRVDEYVMDVSNNMV